MVNEPLIRNALAKLGAARCRASLRAFGDRGAPGDPRRCAMALALGVGMIGPNKPTSAVAWYARETVGMTDDEFYACTDAFDEWTWGGKGLSRIRTPGTRNHLYELVEEYSR